MLNSNNLALHALANIDVKTVSLEKYRVDRQLNLVCTSEYLIKEYFWKHLAVIICRCFIDFIVLFLCIAVFLV